jgi:hypothetical protein
MPGTVNSVRFEQRLFVLFFVFCFFVCVRLTTIETLTTIVPHWIHLQSQQCVRSIEPDEPMSDGLPHCKTKADSVRFGFFHPTFVDLGPNVRHERLCSAELHGAEWRHGDCVPARIHVSNGRLRPIEHDESLPQRLSDGLKTPNDVDQIA